MFGRKLDLIDMARFAPALIPNPIVVAGDYAKPIVARGQVSVEGLPPGAGILPIGIDPVELVAKQNPFRDCKAQGGVVDFEPVGVGGEYVNHSNPDKLSVGDDTK